MQEGQIQGGYILLARKLFDSWLMDKPPLWMKLWVWMVGEANWKDRDKLKKGQFVATIADMQEAMGYHIGYRKKIPTKDQIRNAYEAFAKATMITTTKTTRGNVITICNYDKYQDFKAYEGHSEDHNEDVTKTETTPHHTESIENKNYKNITKTPRARIASLYCQAFERTNVPSMAWEQLDDILAKFSMEQIEDAFKKLVGSNGKTLNYLIGILEGKGKPKGGKQNAKQANGAEESDEYAGYWNQM